MPNDHTNLLERAKSDSVLRESLRAAKSAEDMVRIAADHGIPLDVNGLGDSSELSDAELEHASGGTILHPTMSVFCGTNGSFCTFNPYACKG